MTLPRKPAPDPRRPLLALVVLLPAIAAAQPSGKAADAMVVIPAGPFLMGDDQGEPDEGPRRQVTLPAFAIDRTEVTLAAYLACVSARRCAAPRPAPAAAAPGDLPVTGVSHRDAAAYCAFVGKRLPTEAEWEKAAVGPSLQAPAGARYPFGDTFACSRGNFGSYQGEGRCAAEGAPGRPVPVGSYPQGASPYGVLDMAGNVWEWVVDRYPGRYDAEREVRALVGFTQVAARPTDLRVLRGGGCCSIFGLPRASDRLPAPVDYVDVDIGFRCAR